MPDRILTAQNSSRLAPLRLRAILRQKLSHELVDLLRLFLLHPVATVRNVANRQILNICFSAVGCLTDKSIGR